MNRTSFLKAELSKCGKAAIQKYRRVKSMDLYRFTPLDK